MHELYCDIRRLFKR